MIIAISDTRYHNYLTWKPDGDCTSKKSCHSCEFYKQHKPEYCVKCRVLLISFTNQNKLPYTFDTDDYPEVFI